MLLRRGTLAQEKNPSSTFPKHLDRAWFRKMLTEETEHWLKAAATPNGFFQVNLDRQWRPYGNQTATLVSQSRQIFVMATGYELTRNKVYLDALRKGTDFLIANFHDNQYGGMVNSVFSDGTLLEDRKNSYGTAFAIFGLSYAACVTGENRYRQAALEAWFNMKQNLRDDAGFYKPSTTRDYSQKSGTNSQNPMMHLFEALLTLYDATQSREIYKDAEDHLNNIYTNLYNDTGGYLPEKYDENWKPLPSSKGRNIDLGHQFEWAFLLSKACEMGFPQKYLTIGGRLLEYGMKVAYDHENGGIFSTSDYEGIRDNRPKSWWQQSELLRALMHYASLRNRPDFWEPFHQSLEFVKRHFIDSEYGGWYGSYDPARPREDRALNKGSVWQVGYHICGMYAEAVRLTGGFNP